MADLKFSTAPDGAPAQATDVVGAGRAGASVRLALSTIKTFFSDSPTLVTPALGTPSSGTLTNATGLPISTGVSGLGTGVATFLGTPSSANLASAVTDETGSGALVFATSPTLVTPALGTPASGTLTNCTGLPISTGVSGLGANVGAFLATPSSANLAAAVTDETGSGALVFGTSPTIATPTLTLRDASVTTTSGDVAYNATTEELNYSNGQRALSDAVGWTPHASAIFSNGAGTNSYNLAAVSGANGGAIAIPVLVHGHMLFETLTIRQVAAASLRTAEWRLYRQRLNNGNSGENTLDEVSGANGTFSFTPGAASNESSSVGSPPVYLAPGCYWLVIRNTSATQTFNFSGAGAPVLTPNLAQTKAIPALGATLDFVAATWTKNTSIPNFILKGRVFGETTVF